MLDVIICVMIGLGLMVGYRRGAVVQIGSIVGVVAAIIASRLFGGYASQLVSSLLGWAPGSTETEIIAPFVGHLIIFIIAWLAVALLSGVIRDALKALHVGFIDSVCGAVVMGLKVIIAASILLNLWVVADDAFEKKEKTVGGPVARATLRIVPELLGYAGVKTSAAR